MEARHRMMRRSPSMLVFWGLFTIAQSQCWSQEPAAANDPVKAANVPASSSASDKANGTGIGTDPGRPLEVWHGRQIAAGASAAAGSPGRTAGEPSKPTSKLDVDLSRTFFQDPQPSPETRTADVGGKANEPFLQRLFEALFEEEPTGQGEASQPRRLPPAPYQSPPFPFAEHLGPIVGIRDDAVWPLMEALEDGPNGQFWKDNRIKIYGWADPSITFGTSRNSNIPMVYNIVPNSWQLSRAILTSTTGPSSVPKSGTTTPQVSRP